MDKITKAVVISTAAGTGAKSAIKDITTYLFYWGVPYIRSYGVSVQAMSWEDVKDKKKEKIDRDISKLAKKRKCGRKPKVGYGFKFYSEKYWQDNG